MRVLGQHKNVVNPVLVICPICKRAIKLANSGTIREFVRGHLKVHKDKGTQHGHGAPCLRGLFKEFIQGHSKLHKDNETKNG